MSIHLALFKFYWYDQLPAWSIHLAKAKSHTHIHIRRYLTQVISVLYTQRNRELTWALSTLIHSLKESISLKCKLNVHVKLQFKCKYTTWKGITILLKTRAFRLSPITSTFSTYNTQWKYSPSTRTNFL